MKSINKFFNILDKELELWFEALAVFSGLMVIFGFVACVGLEFYFNFMY